MTSQFCSPASTHNQLLHRRWSWSDWLRIIRKCYRYWCSSGQYKTLADADIHMCIVLSIGRWAFWMASRSHREQRCRIWTAKTAWTDCERFPQEMLTGINNLTEKKCQKTSLSVQSHAANNFDATNEIGVTALLLKTRQQPSQRSPHGRCSTHRLRDKKGMQNPTMAFENSVRNILVGCGAQFAVWRPNLFF